MMTISILITHLGKLVSEYPDRILVKRGAVFFHFSPLSSVSKVIHIGTAYLRGHHMGCVFSHSEQWCVTKQPISIISSCLSPRRNDKIQISKFKFPIGKHWNSLMKILQIKLFPECVINIKSHGVELAALISALEQPICPRPSDSCRIWQL